MSEIQPGMTFRLLFGCFLFTIFTSSTAFAQIDSLKTFKVAVFAPLYLEDAFDGDEYKLGKLSLPRNILPGLEFYNGVMMAVDSLNQEGVSVEISIFDTKNPYKRLEQVFTSAGFANTNLIIASITSGSELTAFATLGATRGIPVISASYPNTTGVTNNPNFVLLNSAFQTHVEGVFKYLQKYHPTDDILFVKRKGAVEDYIRNTFTQLNKTAVGVPVRMRWLELSDSFPARQLISKLDSMTNNVVVVASPLEKFGLRVVRTMSANEAYRTTAVGMPTWDGMKELGNPDCRFVDIVYSTPFFFNQNQLTQHIARTYKSKYKSRPSDMVYRGFEAVYHFTKLLQKHQGQLSSNLTDKSFSVFNEYDIQPVKGRTDSIDYYENKKLYFIKKQEGNLKGVY
ncbi:hypothetical protein EXU57_12700 [Segetibacter sp. 3557_3]|uniref:ABC transporter substrate-binding protein n=1 Tax=Segetibacter sp. 3557_3 TaxID=2547429 RepID=UPI00105854E6|nr:ABC transporter substrate-binding protein [Segetibacter sp. 3557_3]TDH25560.1 hypothetical protein EXU57_12700 [Segetibacter sp. 3557_3]